MKNRKSSLLKHITKQSHFRSIGSVSQTTKIVSKADHNNFGINGKIAVIASCSSVLKKAQELSVTLNLPLIVPNQNISPYTLLLNITPYRLELQENNIKNAKPIVVDFLAPRINYRIKYGGVTNQLIARAVGIKNKKNLVIIDATAGFGIDAFILASFGYKVTMLERSPIINALLEDGIKRLNKNLNLTLKFTQSFDYISKIIREDLEKPDVIYLDPMYPQRPKSALNRKTMRILHKIVGDDDDAPKLLEISLKCAKNRVVVKRPKYANYLGALKPSLQFSSNGNLRYDIYFPKEFV